MSLPGSSGRAVRGRLGGGGRMGAGLAGGEGGVPAGERVEEFAFAAAAHQQQDERVGVQEAGDLEAERGGVFAGPALVGAGAAGDEVARPREEAHLALGQGPGQLLGQQGRELPGLRGDGVQESVPLLVAEGPEADLGAVGAGSAAAYGGDDAARRDVDGVDMAVAGVGPAAGEPGAVEGRGLQRVQPGAAPPGFGEQPAGSGPGRQGREGARAVRAGQPVGGGGAPGDGAGVIRAS